MNILVVSQYYYPEPFRINEICEELVKRKHVVTVLTSNPNYPDGDIYPGYENTYKEEQINGVNIIRCKCKPRKKGAVNLARNYISFVINANRMIKRIDGEFDCVYAYQLSPVISCIPAIKYKKAKSIPMLLYCLDVWPESLRGSILDKKPIYNVLGCVSKWIYSNANKLVVSSPSFCDYVSSLCSMEPKDISFLPQHSKNVVASDCIPIDLNEYKKYVNFVFLGNIGESQNVECIIKAVANIKDRSKMKVHIVGSGSCLEVCKNESKRLCTEDTVVFHGRYPSSKMPLFYAIADVCLVSLKDNGIVGYTIPGKLQEYMSAGKAVLGCINGDAATIIRSANCGYCVSANDHISLAKKMEDMINNKERLLEYGRNAKNYYYNHFTLDSHVNELVSVLDKMIEVSR